MLKITGYGLSEYLKTRPEWVERFREQGVKYYELINSNMSITFFTDTGIDDTMYIVSINAISRYSGIAREVIMAMTGELSAIGNKTCQEYTQSSLGIFSGVNQAE